MMRLTLLTVLALVALMFQACDKDDLCLTGGGNVNAYTLNVPEFTSISLSGPVNLRISQGDDQEITVDAEPELFAHVEYEVTGGIFEIGFRDNVRCYNTVHGVWINITVPDLKGVYVDGDSEIVSSGQLDLSSLTVDVSGVATMNLSGEADTFRLECDGVANADNFGLNTSRSELVISGAADLDISCADHLYIKVNGSAVVHYKGDPQIEQDVSGSLDLVKVD